MTCSIHQPQYLPWLGYFDKMARSDVFVLLDNVQFKKNEWQNRNRIRTANDPGWQWLTVPVLHDHGQAIHEVTFNPSVDWRRQHRTALESSYSRAPYFKEYWPRLRGLYETEHASLSDLNVAGVRVLAEMLGIKTKIVLASALPVTSEKTRRLIDICRAVGADTYIAGAGAEAYMDFGEFRASGETLKVQQYQHPVYDQFRARTPEQFVSHLSVVDLLFNAGPEAGRMICARG